MFISAGQRVDRKPFAWTLVSAFFGAGAAGMVSPDDLRFWVVASVYLAIFCGITALRFK